MAPTLLTTAQVAERLDLDPSSVRRLIRAGHIPATRFGRDWVVDAAVLDRAAAKFPPPGRPPKKSRKKSRL